MTQDEEFPLNIEHVRKYEGVYQAAVDDSVFITFENPETHEKVTLELREGGEDGPEGLVLVPCGHIKYAYMKELPGASIYIEFEGR